MTELEFIQAAEISVNSDEELPIQLDGDYWGNPPARIKAVPRALEVIVPIEA